MATKKTKSTKKETAKPAINLSNLAPSPGSHHRKKIVGRGVGSGHGRHATRGMKGQRARAGDTKMIGFIGGQMPMIRRTPKRGFVPPFPKQFAIVNVQDLNDRFENNTEITPTLLLEKGILKKELPLKVLGTGELKKPLKVKAQAFSQSAKSKIESAGGSTELL